MMLAKHASHMLSAKLIKNAKVCQGLNTHTHTKHTRAFTLIKSNQYQGHLSNTLFFVFLLKTTNVLWCSGKRWEFEDRFECECQICYLLELSELEQGTSCLWVCFLIRKIKKNNNNDTYPRCVLWWLTWIIHSCKCPARAGRKWELGVLLIYFAVYY